jgi:hypothetical protein
MMQVWSVLWKVLLVFKPICHLYGHPHKCAGCENLNLNTAACNSPAPSTAPAPSLVNDMDEDMPDFEDKVDREDAPPAPALSSSLLINMDEEPPASEGIGFCRLNV